MVMISLPLIYAMARMCGVVRTHRAAMAAARKRYIWLAGVLIVFSTEFFRLLNGVERFYDGPTLVSVHSIELIVIGYKSLADSSPIIVYNMISHNIPLSGPGKALRKIIGRLILPS